MTDHKRYKVNKRLPSILVDKALLQSIENYTFNNIHNLINISKEDIKNNYVLEIVESSGELQLNTIESYENNLFPENTNLIAIRLSCRNIKENIQLSYRVRFSENEFSSTIEIDITSSNPKEIAKGILLRLEDIISEKKTLNFLFQPRPRVYLAALLIIFIPQTALYFFNVNSWGAVVTILNLLLILWLFFGKWKPYISFDTYTQRRNDKIVNWLLLGFISFVLFTSALTIFRKHLIGQ